MTPGRVCVFCGSHVGGRPAFREAAIELVDEIVERDLGLVFGGGRVGLMGTVADRMLERGGEVIGVIPHGLRAREVGHDGVDLRVVGTMHERKALMAELSGGFVALPGGLGTLEELFEALTWHQLGIHRKPCGLLDVAGYWEPLLAMLDRATSEGFVNETNRRLLQVADTPAALLDRMTDFRSPITVAWLEPDAI